MVLSSAGPGDGGGVLSPPYIAFMRALNASAWTFRDLGRPSVVGFDSFATYMDSMPQVAASYVTADNSSTFATVTVIGRPGVGQRLVAYMAQSIAALEAQYAVSAVMMTGDAVFDRDIDSALLDDLASMDSVAFPLAVAVLALVLQV